MKKKRTLTDLTQIRVAATSLGLLKVIKNHNSTTSGFIDFADKTFHHTPYLASDLIFLSGISGFGLNEEIITVVLPIFKINRISVPYQDTEFITTATTWRQLGKVCPSGNQEVDRLIVLPLNDLNSAVDNNLFRDITSIPP